MSERRGTTPVARPVSLLWMIATALRRAGAQWRMLVAVLVVALLSSTLVTSLGLLVTMTEQGAVRGGLAAVPGEQTGMNVRVLDSSSSLSRTREVLDAGVAKALGSRVSATSQAMAFSDLDAVHELRSAPALAYFAVLEDVSTKTTLEEGVWASKPGDVTIPAAAAHDLNLHLGSSFAVDIGKTDYSVTVVGIYSATAPKDEYWVHDALHGAGSNPAFPNPAFTFYRPIEAFGPLVVTSDGFDSAKIPPASLVVDYTPDFSATTVDDLAPTLSRLSTLNDDLHVAVGKFADTLVYTSDVSAAIGNVAAGLVVTRSTVVVISLMLLILSVVAMAQTARLFTDGRAGERQLMRARGASRRTIVALSVVEALVLGLATALASPVLALLVYRLLAQQPAMVAAGMPAQAELSALTWATAIAVAVVFVLVLIAPLVRQSRSFAEEESAKARQGTRSALMRSGIDVALLALAAIAYWQLQSYRSVGDGTASLSVDPVLVVGPALVLIAGALLSVRLIPVLAKIVERVASRARGAIAPLASWELGRRAQRVTAAVLLLSLALAVGTFSLAFLATWRQSQTDQAILAVGPAVRMPAGVSPIGEADALARGAHGAAQPALRRTAQLSLRGATVATGSGAPVEVLALTPQARAMLDRGRLSELGGSDIRRRLSARTEPSLGIDLPAGITGLSATVQVGDGELPGVTAQVRAIVEDSNGLLATVDLGSVPVDGRAHAATGSLELARGGTVSGSLRVVGFQTAFTASQAQGLVDSSVPVLFKDLATSTGVALGTAPVWKTGSSSLLTAPPKLLSAKGWDFGMRVAIPATVQFAPVSFALVGWEPITVLPALVPAALADDLQFTGADSLSLRTEDVTVGASISGTPQLIPGSAPESELVAGSLGSSSAGSRAATIVVDQSMLSRVLMQAGVPGPTVDEWWVDVAPGREAAYLAQHRSPVADAPAFSGEVLGLQLQQTPLRVATQAALWLAILAGGLLAAVGFAVHSTATLRARRVELAQLRAIGLSRRKLLALVASESLLLAALGTFFGIAIGILLVFLVGPLVAVSADGSPPVPTVQVQLPFGDIGLLALEVLAVLAVVVLAVARAQRFTNPADLLRGGAQL